MVIYEKVACKTVYGGHGFGDRNLGFYWFL